MLRGLLLSVSLPAALVVLWFWWNTGAYNASDNALQAVVVYPGATDSAIGNLLYGRGLIESTIAYKLYLRLNGLRGKMQAGTYEISPAMSVAEITQKFGTGEVVTSVMTILPAQRLSQVRDRFLSGGYTEQEVDEALDTASYQGHPALAGAPSGATLEGYLHAESYQYTSATPLQSIVRSSLGLTAALFTDEVKRGLAEQGLTLHQAVILASIVEQEANDPNLKPLIAQVFLKRLTIGMELGSDVTAYYGASLEGLREAVKVDTPYNTRIHKGLPPGPISNISASSLQAVAMPATTGYLYFVAGDDGKTYFSYTEAEHEQMKEKYCKVLCQLE